MSHVALTMIIALRAIADAARSERVLAMMATTRSPRSWRTLAHHNMINAPLSAACATRLYERWAHCCNLDHAALAEEAGKRRDPGGVLEQVTAAEIPEDWQFDALIVDEGQDFEAEWFEILQLFLKEDGAILWFEDPLQNIYQRGDVELDGTGQPWEYTDGWVYRVVDGTCGQLFVTVFKKSAVFKKGAPGQGEESLSGNKNYQNLPGFWQGLKGDRVNNFGAKITIGS